MSASLVIHLEASIEDEAWARDLPEAEAVIARALDALFEEPEARAALGEAEEADISLLLTSDARMAALNAEWRGKDKPTNVLSFPSDAPPFPGEPLFLGDLALGYGVCAAEAEAAGKPLADHLAHLAIHGALHVLGFDHETGEADAQEMESIEIKALARLGLPDPYAEPAA